MAASLTAFLCIDSSIDSTWMPQSGLPPQAAKDR